MSTMHFRITQYVWFDDNACSACGDTEKVVNTTYHLNSVTCKRCIETEQYKQAVSKQIARRMKG